MYICIHLYVQTVSEIQENNYVYVGGGEPPGIGAGP